MTSTIVLSVIIFLLVVGLSVCIYRINLEKHYYRYTFNKSEKLEKELKDEQDKKGKYIRRERYAGSMSRSFYVGEGVKQSDVHAKYEDGILRLDIPKPDKKAVEESKYISIEG